MNTKLSSLNIERIYHHCVSPINEYHLSGYNAAYDYTYLVDPIAKVLAIAHLDTVQKFTSFTYDSIDNVIWTETLDDRIGVYVILEWLKTRNIVCDVLLTNNEELMSSTAMSFQPVKQYNWMVEFDRMGDSVVSYQYECKALKSKLKAVGYNRIESGSYTDICELSFLGCLGFNVGVGYTLNHSVNAHMDLNILESNLLKFETFYRKFSSTHMPYDGNDTKTFPSARWYDPEVRYKDDYKYNYTYGLMSFMNKTKMERSISDDIMTCDICKLPFQEDELTYTSRLGFLCDNCYEWSLDDNTKVDFEY